MLKDTAKWIPTTKSSSKNKTLTPRLLSPRKELSKKNTKNQRRRDQGFTYQT